MSDLKTIVASYIEQLKGTESENAFHRLIELDSTVVPLLVEAFRTEADSTTRSILVEIIGQYRLPEMLDFFSDALADSAPQVWKSALDEVVTIGGESAIQTLESSKQHFQNNKGKDYSTRAKWIDEAIQQVRDQSS